MTSDPVHYLSLTDVSERLRRGELKPTALSKMILARIDRHEGNARTEESPRPSTSAIPILPYTKAVATRKGWANWASTTRVGRRFAGPLPNWSL